MEFRVLGPVQLWADDRTVDAGPAQQCVVLAALAVDAQRLVPTEVLVDRVWGARPPQRARRTLHTHITRIRRLLERFSEAGDPAPLVLRRTGGYLLSVDRMRVDLHRFRQLVDRANSPACDGYRRAALLREAVGLWRGEPLPGLLGEWAARMRESWRHERVAAVLAWAYAEIDLGNAAAVVAPLNDLVADHPLVEPVAAGLMRALYAAGRAPEALAWYTRTRRHLVEELGAEPGAELQDLHRAILRGEPVRSASPVTASPPAEPPAGTVPAQLPLNVAGFTGRSAEIAQLDALLAATGEYPTSVLLAVVSGTAGVGKTALAVHWAHRVAARFGDGQLYVNLRGFDPSGAAMDPAEAVRGFLDAFEVPPPRIPAGLSAQINLYRSLVAGRRMLLLLDNAVDADQVRPLLPGGPGCLVLVTSRNRLTGLIAAEGARPIPLDLLSTADAHELLARKLGRQRVSGEPRAVAEIIAACARLPLALAIAAARAASHPVLPLHTLAAQLRGARGGLDGFAVEDATIDFRTVLSWSYRALDAAAARLFRLLAMHPAPDVGVPAAASLAGVRSAEAARLLAGLARANLLAEPAPGRFAFHDLLRSYAAELAAAVDSEAEQEAALQRMLDHYLHTAHAAALLLQPHRDPLTIRPPRPGVTPERMSDHRSALNWFTREHAALLGAIERAQDAGQDSRTWQLAWTVLDYFDRRGHWHDQVTAQRAGLDAAARLGDRAGQAYSLRGLARAWSRLRRYDRALTYYRRALDLFGELGDLSGQARTHLNLGVVFEQEQRVPEALHHTQKALELYRLAGHVAGEAEAVNAVGWCHAQLGEYRAAQECCEQALALLGGLGDLHSEANTWDTLGYVHDQLGAHEHAIECYLRAVELFRQTGGRYFEADTLGRLGEAWRAAGDQQRARDAFQRALSILDDLGHTDAERVRAKLGTGRADRSPEP